MIGLASIHDVVSAIPLPVAKGLFVGLYAILAIWILTLPRAEVRPSPDRGRLLADLRLWAIVVAGIQIAVYALL